MMMHAGAPTTAQPLMRRKALGLVMLAAFVLTARGQYPGHIDSAKKAAPTVRAVAVLEWTGEQGKPNASRLIPISVFDGEQYQPGGLYLAKPEPLALEPGTEYVLQDAGVARGLFDINNAQNMDGYWFGYGAWKPMAAVVKQRAKPKQGTHLPQVVQDANDGRPHFKNRNAGDSQESSTSSDSTASSSPSSNKSAPAGDPDRPTLRKRQDSSGSTPAAKSDSAAAPAPETATAGGDPDRPHITRGQQNPTNADFKPTELTGVPDGLEQTIAISDTSDRESHPFVYLWAELGDADKMKEQMQIAATAAIAATEPPVKTATRPRTTTAATAPTTAHGTNPTTTVATRRRATTTAVAPPKAVFTNERFKAYELTYSGGATLVYTAQTQDHAGKTKYVTLIAQPDFSGVPRVLFKSVTDDDHLDQTPKMRLVDAVDTRANNRGDLVFELRRTHDREFVIYRVGSGQAEQVFSTGSLANSPSRTDG